MSFGLGATVMTQGVAKSTISHEDIIKIVNRHANGDWGELSEEDKELNDAAVANGTDRILSSYTVDDEKIWVITEADRSVTTILFPREY